MSEHLRGSRDALTPSEDFIISPHASCSNLFIATCGSLHGFKFFPILGKYVVQMLDEELDSVLKDKWAWDRELPATGNNPMWPRMKFENVRNL